MIRPTPVWQLVLAFALSLALLAGLIGWLQNVHIVTANGMYKSIQAEPWIADPAQARLDPSNYLYFPLYGAMSRLLDVLGIARGVPWKQFAYLNAFWASLATVFVYAFAYHFAGSARVAALAALFHLGCGTVLLLSVINEDIMPGYALVLGAMLLAGLWFERPTYGRVLIVAAVFTLGWLMEWRLLFPTLPALGLALLAAEGPVRRRIGFAAALVVAMVATAGIVQQVWEGHNGAVGLHDLLWTGKGVTSGWAGLAWGKLWMMLGGVGNYLFLLEAYPGPQEAQADVVPLTLSAFVQLAILGVAVIILWPRRREPRVRTVAIVFLGTLAAGQVLNIYSQPHDPQMQINVMACVVVGWIAVLTWTLGQSRPAVTALVVLLSALPLIANAVSLARWQGGDARAIAALGELERRLPPEKTVFVYWGFEPITMWQYALWSRTWDWDGAFEVSRAPSDSPRFKWIAISAGAIRHPQWTPEQHAQSLRRDVDMALDRGYEVVVSSVWRWPVDQFATQLAGLAASNRAAAIHEALHAVYDAQPVYTDPTGEIYFRLKRR